MTAAGLALLPFAFCMTAALVAAFVRGLAGFGMAILLVPLLGLVIPPREAVVVSNLLGLLIGMVGARKVWSTGEKSAGVIGALAMLLTPAGLLLLAATPPGLARLLIALVAIGAFVLVLLPPRPDGHRPGAIETGLTGASAGLLTGFAGMPGPPVVPYYVRRALPPTVARASMQTVFLLTSLASTVAAIALGFASRRDILLAAALFLPVLLGNRIGALAFGKVSAAAWRGFVGFLLGASALVAAIKLLN